MKPIMLAMVAMCVISVGAYVVLGEVGVTTESQGTSSSNVRLD
ncbi:hypothetical protein [Tropicimonas sp. S265A]